MKNMTWHGDKVMANVENAKKGGLSAAALIVEGSAVLRAPVGRYGQNAGTYRSGPMAGKGRVGGNLRSSITHKVIGNEEAHIGTNVEYAPNVELGIGQAPQPYLRPALDNNKSRIEKMIGNAIGEAVKR